VRNRWLSLTLVIVEAIWLNVVVPGHQRGCIQLPGVAAIPVCPFCAAAATSHDSKSSSPTGPAATCAICFFAAHLSIPPTIDLTPPPLRPAGLVDAPAIHSLISRQAQIPFDGRGPPARA